MVGGQSAPPTAKDNKIMNVQIETQIHEWDSNTAGIFLKLCNLLTFVKNREELETALKHTPFRELFN